MWSHLEIGQIIKTSYDTGPYKIKEIVRGCTCTHILDEIESKVAPLPPHLHLTLVGVGGDHNDGEVAYLGYYDEQTLQSVWCDDRIILCENREPVQQSFVL
jgi:hypothetical protein